LLIHLRLRAVAPVTRGKASGGSSTPETYCGQRQVPRGLSAPDAKAAGAIAQTLDAEVCASCLEGLSAEDRLR
jgi:hypothetical protein